MKRVVLLCSALLFLLNALIKSQAPFGIDVERYGVVLQEGISDWSPYYLKEVLSWGVLDLISNLSPYLNLSGQLIFLDGVVLVAIFAACFKSGFVAYRFPFFYVTFAFILLSFNVLRQYVALVFLVAALVASVNKWPKRFLLWIVLAIASHNGSVLVAPALMLVFLRDIKSSYKILLTICAAASIVLMSTNEVVLRAFETSVDALEEPFWKVVLYATLSCYMSFLVWLRHKEAVRRGLKSIQVVSNSKFSSVMLFCIGLLIMCTPFTNWIISRNWITIISLQIFLYLCMPDSGRYTKSSVRSFVFIYFLPMMLVVAFHTGAWQMAFGE